MFKYILEGAGQINWMAIAALLTFVAVFVVGAIVAFRAEPTFIDKMANLPLDDSKPFNAENGNHDK